MTTSAPARLDARTLVPEALFLRLTNRIAKDQGIDQPQAELIMTDALAFLAACGANPGAPLSPSESVDIGWHTFILYTAEYAEFCDRVAGRFIYHGPKCCGCPARTGTSPSTCGCSPRSPGKIDSPQPDDPLSYRIYQARRPQRVPSRPEYRSRPMPGAVLDVGVIVHGTDGILLNNRWPGAWALPGRYVSPGESFSDAAARELHYAATLVADPSGIRPLGTVLGHVGNVPRLTVPVLVTAWSGTSRQYDDGIGAWKFWPADALPQPLIDSTAQCLTAWRPGLPLDHPATEFHPYGATSDEYLPPPGR
ncbi:NUDIX domain-containing protein [Actinacidiphila alni]|uniref:NUDIX domain-containing protein n=1 Tax=Actinacidiphila alni TaxID=380248 RepID=UPI0033D4C173